MGARTGAFLSLCVSGKCVFLFQGWLLMDTAYGDNLNDGKVKKGAGRVEILELTSRVMAKCT